MFRGDSIHRPARPKDGLVPTTVTRDYCVGEYSLTSIVMALVDGDQESSVQIANAIRKLDTTFHDTNFMTGSWGIGPPHK